MTKLLRETATLSERAAADAKKTGRMLVQFISPGWGSSGYYGPEVLEQAVTDQVIPAGTHMYADHPTDAEDIERPVRSIKDLMAVTVEDARLSEDGALVGEVQVVPQWRDLVETVREQIGVSIRGSATDIVVGEAEGRQGGIIEGLVAPVLSVDFVTRAGRGGKVLSVLESARANKRAIAHGVEEATVNDTREALQAALRDAHATAKDVWLYVRDFDDSTVWFELDGSGAGDAAGIYGQTYTEDDGAVTLTGTRTEVRVQTTYVPATRPGSNTPTEESQEDTMPQIEESELTRLREDAGRVTALESERDTERDARVAAERERDQLRARESAVTHARTRVTTANASLPASTVDRIVEAATRTVPLTEAGQLDTTALDTAVDASRTTEEAYLAGLAEAAGVGSISGFGGTAAGDLPDISESDIDAHVGGAFGRTQVQEA
jgi:hypothetical protein